MSAVEQIWFSGHGGPEMLEELCGLSRTKHGTSSAVPKRWHAGGSQGLDVDDRSAMHRSGMGSLGRRPAGERCDGLLEH